MWHILGVLSWFPSEGYFVAHGRNKNSIELGSETKNKNSILSLSSKKFSKGFASSLQIYEL